MTGPGDGAGHAEPAEFAFTPEHRALADRIIAKYPPGRQASAVLPLLDLAQHIREIGVPVIVTDPHGVPRDTANLPFVALLDSQQMHDYVFELDAQNPPVIEPGVGIVHFGNTPLVRGLRVIPVIR